jgi:hypothetical protein
MGTPSQQQDSEISSETSLPPLLDLPVFVLPPPPRFYSSLGIAHNTEAYGKTNKSHAGPTEALTI